MSLSYWYEWEVVVETVVWVDVPVTVPVCMVVGTTRIVAL
jgi:hypothetical protein